MHFDAPDPTEVIFPDVYYAKPLVETLQQRRNLNLCAQPPEAFAAEAIPPIAGCTLRAPDHVIREQGHRLLPGIGVSAENDTASERIVFAGPLSEIATISVAPGAWHLASLVKMLFAERGLQAPELIDDSGDSKHARLLSGNQGREATGLPGHDLGALWRETTDLPLVLAVWSCGKRAPYRKLRSLLGAAAREHETLGNRAIPDKLHYTVLSRESDSLRAYQQLAIKHGLAEANAEAIVFC